MREAEFRKWLTGRGTTDHAINNRVGRAKRTEKALRDLGIAADNLDAAFDQDRLEGALQALKAQFAAYRQSGVRPLATLVPKAPDPTAQLRNVIAATRKYRDFRANIPMASAWPQLEALRERFIDNVPDFEDFSQREGSYWEDERRYKDEMLARVAAILERDDNEESCGRQIYRALIPNSGPLLRWQTDDAFHRQHPELGPAFYATIGALARDRGPLMDAIARAVASFAALREAGAKVLTPGQQLAIILTVAACARPLEMGPFKTTKAKELAEALTGEKIFQAAIVDMAEIARWLELNRRIFAVMRDEWGWQPRDMFDVQGFVWVALDEGWFSEGDDDAATADQIDELQQRMTMTPTNLILYGPPGTGKTYATAREAVRLCDGGGDYPETEEGRALLMARYRELADAGRIEFVTFHQNFSYEDFVEGLRPVQLEGAEEGDKAQLSPGFQLKAEPGIFHRIARRAETSTGTPRSGFTLDNRAIWKMSIGEAANVEDAYLFDEAITEHHTLLGFGDIDWSEPRFADRNAILAKWRDRGPENEAVTASSGKVKCSHAFRNRLKVGDIVIISKGNSLFRAIGEVTGDYQYSPRESGDYSHRRAVRWLWHDRAGVSVEEIYSKGFAMGAIYELVRSEINLPALESFIASGHGSREGGTEAAPPFVLIIDEINRANISKVFGELITLLEPDKRLGGINALKVRLPYSKAMFGIPANLHIIGTMNTADRSIALLDTALRRRFAFRELMPDPNVLAVVDGVNLPRVLETLNARIEYLFDRDHQIGHAYFIGCATRADVDAAMRHKVIPLLAEYFYEDWGRVAAVLGDAAGAGRFLTRTAINPPPGLEDAGDGEPRWRWTVNAGFASDAYQGFA